MKRFLLACTASMLLWGTAWAQSIDIDEQRTAPVAHRYLHGILGDAKFELSLPAAWNGKLLIGTRGFSGTELSSGAFKTVGLAKGYAFAFSDEGWNRVQIVNNPEDFYFESRRRLVQLTGAAKQLVQRHYGKPASRTYATGGSNGGHHSKWIVEDYPALFDGAVSGYGFNSNLEQWGDVAQTVRNYDVVRPRIADIVAKRAASPAWNPATEPLSPPLTGEQVTALQNIYNIPARIGAVQWNNGRPPGSEFMWEANRATLLGYLRDSMPRFDRTYDPNGDGVISEEELKNWNPDHSPVQIQNDLRKLDLHGNLKRPIIIAHGGFDVTVAPGESVGYMRLVESRLGVVKARDVLAVYFIPGMGHGGGPFNTWLNVAYDALDAWVDWHQSGGRQGSVPPFNLGGYTRE
jgi:Tannase and feruloyl esterase